MEKSWQFSRFFVRTKTKAKTLGLKTKTKTLLFVLEAPRDQDFGLEDYITAHVTLQNNNKSTYKLLHTASVTFAYHLINELINE